MFWDLEVFLLLGAELISCIQGICSSLLCCIMNPTMFTYMPMYYQLHIPKIISTAYVF